MRIGFDCRAAAWYKGTGIGNYSYKLIENILPFKPHSYDLYTPNNYFINNLSSYDSPITFHSITGGNKDGFWNRVNSNQYELSRNLDIFHTPQNGIGLPQNKSCPLVVTLHDIIPLRMPETVSKTFNEMFHEKIHEIMNQADGIITVSEFSKQDILKEFSFTEEKIFVTHLASDTTYKPINNKLSKYLIKNKFHIDDDYILYIGGFTPRKNIWGIIKAYENNFEKLKNKYKLVIAGKKGISYSLYKEYVDKHNLTEYVIFTGFVDNIYLPFLYNAASLFIFPSFYEGFGLPPLEAMACGTPVIASNVTSVPEVLKDGALYVDPNNIDDISQKMLELLNNPVLQEKLIAKGLRVNATYSWDQTALQTLNAYEKIRKSVF
ncbi:glycosyltransferase family 4 protein [Oceanirhabdus sp. W0125-5]|uniref:glycosyltransferase family 4 protein n=1 Tax=Oceanirhabdus sp. W0125-5 TaxID=2999116 RepID=UPI0022F2F10D|nr:glycosyltransferase family 1 protein [Oceanirhabdus sp. W0125-5]WBW98448.1 glycosyltransferase family 1 protein [Oceanirhabdus sp. W0125-5]